MQKQNHVNRMGEKKYVNAQYGKMLMHSVNKI